MCFLVTAAASTGAHCGCNAGMHAQTPSHVDDRRRLCHKLCNNYALLYLPPIIETELLL